jgi:hypothetical protein
MEKAARKIIARGLDFFSHFRMLQQVLYQVAQGGTASPLASSTD